MRRISVPGEYLAAAVLALLLAGGILALRHSQTPTTSVAPPSSSAVSSGPSPVAASPANYTRSGEAICAHALTQIHSDPKPTTPAEVTRYLVVTRRVGAVEISQLGALDPPARYATSFKLALRLSDREEAALKTTVGRLRAGQPFSAVYPSLAATLKRVDPRVNAAFVKAGLPECAK